MGAKINKRVAIVVTVLEDRPMIACDIDTPKPRPLSLQWMVSQSAVMRVVPEDGDMLS